MSLLDAEPAPTDPRRLALEGARTADRLRTLSVVRLAAATGPGPTRAQAALALAQELADESARLAGRPQRDLPRLPDTAAGDVLAVCVADLVEALAAIPADDRAGLCARAVEQLRQLRARL